MRLFMSLLLPAMLIGGLAFAQEPAPVVAPDPAKVAEYQKRFQDGYALEQEGKLTGARTVFDGILAEEPEAKRSLLEAGRISLKLGEWAKADDYLERLHALAPDFPEAFELLIQANQGLKRDMVVEQLIRDFSALRDSGKVPQFGQSPNFVREQIQLPTGDPLVITQYFNYTAAPLLVWKAQVLDASGGVKRQLVLAYDPRATKALRAKDPKLAAAEQFLLIEDVLLDGHIVRVDAYFQMFSLPEYKKVRNTMLAILGGVYKPVYSQKVEATGT